MRFKQDKAALAGGIVIVLLIFLAIFGGPLAERITGHAQNEPYRRDDDRRLRHPAGAELVVLVRRRRGR